MKHYLLIHCFLFYSGQIALEGGCDYFEASRSNSSSRLVTSSSSSSGSSSSIAHLHYYYQAIKQFGNEPYNFSYLEFKVQNIIGMPKDHVKHKSCFYSRHMNRHRFAAVNEITVYKLYLTVLPVGALDRQFHLPCINERMHAMGGSRRYEMLPVNAVPHRFV